MTKRRKVKKSHPWRGAIRIKKDEKRLNELKRISYGELYK